MLLSFRLELEPRMELERLLVDILAGSGTRTSLSLTIWFCGTKYFLLLSALLGFFEAGILKFGAALRFSRCLVGMSKV